MADSALDPPATNNTALVSTGGTALTSPNDTASLNQRLTQIFSADTLRRALPIGLGLAATVAAGYLFMNIAAGPQRTLYGNLSDAERGQVVAALEPSGISYTIDPGTGAITVAEADLYRARMLVASDGAVAVPESSADLLNSIPLGSSRTLEGERLRLARERELMLTIREIDGIESARVHLATPTRSVFIRNSSAPSASVMLRIARGRNLAKGQVDAIVNLVAASVPGLPAENVRVADQSGRLLSAPDTAGGAGLARQHDYEEKLRNQIAKLLVPLLGEGNFSSEVQVELDFNEVTSARESYEKEGAIRHESEAEATRASAGAPGGVPGVLSNTPPPPAIVDEAAPQGTAAAKAPTGVDRESSAERAYELDREVAVTSNTPGTLVRLSVAVAVSEAALQKIAPADEGKIKSLIMSAVGANTDRGDEVTVVVGKFDPIVEQATPFYETGWFAMVLRNAAALIAVLLVLLLAVRPLLRGLTSGKTANEDNGFEEEDEEEEYEGDGDDPLDETVIPEGQEVLQQEGSSAISASPNANLRDQIELARRLANEQPERAVAALQRMLAAPKEPVP